MKDNIWIGKVLIDFPPFVEMAVELEDFTVLIGQHKDAFLKLIEVPSHAHDGVTYVTRRRGESAMEARWYWRTRDTLIHVLIERHIERDLPFGEYRTIMERLYDLSKTQQVICTTESPYILDYAPPASVVIFLEGPDGCVSAAKFADFPRVKRLIDQGFSLGEIWFNGKINYEDKEETQ